MPRIGPRTHRLPHRLDYTLIPAPLDLSLPLASEKAPLPAIIVTPSSPSSSQDFSIAFLAPPTKPHIWDRIIPYFTPSQPQLQVKARAAFILLFITFILACHVVTLRLATLDKNGSSGGSVWDWLDFRSLWGDAAPASTSIVDQ